MTASYVTVEAVYRAIRRHVTEQQVEKIVDDLLQIPGNKSFRETVNRLKFFEEAERERDWTDLASWDGLLKK